MLIKRLKNNKGFTYIELLIVISIFSLLSVVIANIFILFTKSQIKTSVQEKLIADGRYLLENITRKIRNSKIDYSKYSLPIANPVKELHLIDDKGDKFDIIFTKECGYENVVGCVLLVKKDFQGIISGEDVNVDYLNFYITPDKDPFVINEQGTFLANEQPMVTILLGISSVKESGVNNISINLQTSISSKVYVR